MRSFLFITHLTPSAKRSALRQSLYELYRKALLAQTYPNWKALIIGEQELSSGKIIEVNAHPVGERRQDAQSVSQLYDRKDIRGIIESADYIIKVDDDDLIAPTLLERVHTLDFDIYYDEHHTFYDITSGILSQQKRPWIASTCIQRTAHAFAKLHAGGSSNYYENSIFYQDHSKIWHTYYADKKRMVATPQHPVYLRVLSPTSISSGSKRFPLKSAQDVDFSVYYSYLKTFGFWQKAPVKDFDLFLPALQSTWENFSGRKQITIPANYLRTSLTERLASYGKAFRKLF